MTILGFNMVHHADSMVVGVGDVEVAIRIQDHTVRSIQRRLRSRPAITRRPRLTADTRHGRELAVVVDLAHAVVESVCDEDRAVASDREVTGSIETSFEGVALLTREAALGRLL